MATKSKKAGKRTKVSKATASAEAKPGKVAKPSAKTDAGKPKPKKSGEGKRVSALDAAAQILAKAGKPMRSREIIAAMTEQGLWKSPAGKTPWATLYSAMMREEREKGKDSRFKKTDRGLFAANV